MGAVGKPQACWREDARFVELVNHIQQLEEYRRQFFIRICCNYITHRHVDLEIWWFSCRPRQQQWQTYKPITLPPCTCVRGKNYCKLLVQTVSTGLSALFLVGFTFLWGVLIVVMGALLVYTCKLIDTEHFVMKGFTGSSWRDTVYMYMYVLAHTHTGTVQKQGNVHVFSNAGIFRVWLIGWQNLHQEETRIPKENGREDQCRKGT